MTAIQRRGIGKRSESGTKCTPVPSRSISDLVENQDLVKGTVRYFIVGYLVKHLTEARVVRRKAAAPE